MPEGAVAHSLVALAGADPLVIRRAQGLVGTTGEHAYARQRLQTAERLLPGAKVRPPGDALNAWLLAVFAPATAVTLPRWPMP